MPRNDDDIVFTLSDNDDVDVSDFSEPETAPEQKSTKRKRDERPAPKSKKQKLKQDESEGEENALGLKDDALDSDFEFEVGANRLDDQLEEFDGWGDASRDSRSAKKRGVDLDDIIARRQKKDSTSPQSEKHPVDKAEQGSQEADTEDREEDEVDSDHEDAPAIDFDNDELLADDAFGAAAESEEDGPSDADEAADDDASDNDSVASPTAHPEDEATDDDASTDNTSPDSDVEEEAKRAAFFAPESKDKVASAKSFQQFSLSRPILRAVATLNFSSPTPIQQRTIPVALQGLDVVGSAITGSGKTAAFLLPILERLLYRPRRVPTTRVAILMPTRELAVQCHSVAVALTKYTDITLATLVGGFSLREQEATLKKRPDIIIATPGRFIDHMRNSASFTISTLEILVLDEADRMLETGFADELDEILRTLPKSRQTMLFSATMTSTIDNLIRLGMNKPVRVSIASATTTNTTLTQEFVRLRPGRENLRLATLCILCKTHYTARTIVFFRQKQAAHHARILLGLLGLKTGELHGSMSQDQRISAVNGFKDGTITHLLATDLASRGLDIKNVAAVINFEAPQTHEIYVHRVGRTARAGREGRACTIAAEPDRKVVKAAVKAGRGQGAKIVSRALPHEDVDAMHARIEAMDEDVKAVLLEEKETKLLAQTETELSRSENLMKHHDEIVARPKRTWFESEKEKLDAKKRGAEALNNPGGVEVKMKSEKKKLSNKDRKRMDAKRDRKEGHEGASGLGKKKLLEHAGRAREVGKKKKRQEEKKIASGRGSGKGGAGEGRKKSAAGGGGGGSGGGAGKGKGRGKPVKGKNKR